MDPTTAKDRRTIRLDFVVPHPIAKVWRCLTDGELLSRWLMPNDFKPEVGRRFTFRTDPIPDAGFDGIIHCEVVAIEPNHLLSYTWRGGSLDTIVTWTLTESGAGTRLHLEHDGFGPADSMAFDGLSAGWQKLRTGRFLSVLASLD